MQKAEFSFAGNKAIVYGETAKIINIALAVIAVCAAVMALKKAFA